MRLRMAGAGQAMPGAHAGKKHRDGYVLQLKERIRHMDRPHAAKDIPSSGENTRQYNLSI